MARDINVLYMVHIYVALAKITEKKQKKNKKMLKLKTVSILHKTMYETLTT